MPIYEYLCEECGKTTEALRKMDQADVALPCEQCGSERTHRVQSVFAASSGDSTRTTNLPMGGCGRCGDPRGSCGMS